jgi:hypothetical protein
MCARPSSEQFLQRDLGEEPQAAEVHSEDRNGHASRAHAARHAEQRSIAAEHQHQIDAPRQFFA